MRVPEELCLIAMPSLELYCHLGLASGGFDFFGRQLNLQGAAQGV